MRVGLAKAMGISSRNLTPWIERISIDSLQGRKGKKKGGELMLRRHQRPLSVPILPHPYPALLCRKFWI